VDVREDVLSRCDTAADCRLRWGGDCCELCEAPWDDGRSVHLIAVSTLENWRAHVCEDVPGCPPCDTDIAYPSEARAECVDSHCAVVWD
jgi:hypothetical protein